MPGLKDVKTKIFGIKKTAQITKAMNMVASAKLRGAQLKMERFRPYAAQFNAAMANLSGSSDAGGAPLMEVREVKTVEIVVVTSDRGLCGSFNSNIFKQADRMIRQHEAQGRKVSVVCVGRKGFQYFRKTGKVRAHYTDIMSSFQMYNAREIAQDITANFLGGGSDEVKLVFGSFRSVAVQRPDTRDLLPIKPLSGAPTKAAAAGTAGAYSYEPEPAEILQVLLPLHLNVMIYHSMLEVGASEHAARMTAMDNATTACKDMIKQLTLLYNKARQASITSELMDIVGGAEALKG
ncbi:MAG: ATP synthase F1 subunit gamma [Desulfobulbaceae bacterium A2]|nr:MAG: ATP synthase F1 subunit gamma [Desulfobulbaceae bacterium A2]